MRISIYNTIYPIERVTLRHRVFVLLYGKLQYTLGATSAVPSDFDVRSVQPVIANEIRKIVRLGLFAFADNQYSIVGVSLRRSSSKLI
jgi:hypothetical protein